METPDLVLCADGHYRKTIYGIGPYIADYPEQVLASCIVQGWCPLCPKHRTQLDVPGNVGRRSRAHTEELLRLFDLTTLWEDYGVVGNLIVRSVIIIRLTILSKPIYSHLQMTFHELISMSCFRGTFSTR